MVTASTAAAKGGGSKKRASATRVPASTASSSMSVNGSTTTDHHHPHGQHGLTPHHHQTAAATAELAMAGSAAPHHHHHQPHNTYLDHEGSWHQQNFGLDRRLLKACARQGWIYPTLVQSRCIPLALQGKDLLVRARTGSGKTAAYGLPLLHKILCTKERSTSMSIHGATDDSEDHDNDDQDEHNGTAKSGGGGGSVLAVVLVPSRELCAQAKAQIQELMFFCRGVVSLLALTGDNMAAQAAQLRDNPDILVATPARLVAHLSAGNIQLKQTVETLVVDEADLVLSYGYRDDINTITANLPKICQGFLMSATLSEELEELKRVVLHSPATLKLEEGDAADRGQLAQFFIPLHDENDKFLVLFAFLKLGLLEGKGLFFCNTVDKAYHLKLFLESFHIRSAVLNADLPLNSRLHVLEEFNRSIFDYLIATDESIERHTQLDDDDDDEEEEEEEDKDEEEDEDPDDDDDDVDEEGEDEEEDDKGSDDGDDDDDDDDDEDDDDSSGDGKEVKKMKSTKDEGAVSQPAGRKRKRKDMSPPPKQQGQAGGRSKDWGSGAAKFDTEYGVARGIDFRGVKFVVNVDFPVTPHSYTHRVGRTARGGASGSALSLVMMASDEETYLREVQAAQPPLPIEGTVREGNGTLLMAMGPSTTGSVSSGGGGGGVSLPQPSELAFDIREIEQFRYRVDDVKKKITRIMIKEVRAEELKQEMLNSEKLKTYFMENPDDLRVLRHDKTVLHPTKRLEHLKHIPSYLMPQGLQIGEDPTARQRKKRKRGGQKFNQGQGQDASRRKDNDPLQSFDAGSTTAGASGGGAGADKAAPKPMRRIVGMRENLGKSVSGRRKWQEKHKKGKFSKKFASRAAKKKGTRFTV